MTLLVALALVAAGRPPDGQTMNGRPYVFTDHRAAYWGDPGVSTDPHGAITEARRRLGCGPMARDSRLDAIAAKALDIYHETGGVHTLGGKDLAKVGWPVRFGTPPGYRKAGGGMLENWAECGGSEFALGALLNSFLLEPHRREGHQIDFEAAWTHYGLAEHYDPATKRHTCCLWYGYLPEPTPATVAKAPEPFPSRPLPPDLVAAVDREYHAIRAARHLPPVTRNANLDAAAANQARWCAERETLTHGREPGDAMGSISARVKAAGYVDAGMAGENASFVPMPQTVRSWMASPGHRGNILFPFYTDYGLAGYSRADGRQCWIQVFAGSYEASRRYGDAVKAGWKPE